MKVAGIIAEYNPFHNGHALLVEKARMAGATHIVAVMSGNFVQRGEPAMFHHGVRTKAALMNGVDLVIQLPCVYALSGAQSFARAGAEILDALGCVDLLVFGSECGNIDKLVSTAKAVYSNEVQSLLPEEISKGVSFAAARENALRKVFPESADIIRHPNNILGVEYIAALNNISSNMIPVTFERIGASHNSNETVGETASASKIRELILANGEWKKYVPETAGCIFEQAIKGGFAPIDVTAAQNSILYRMRTVSQRELAQAPDVSEGIENRIIKAVHSAVTLEELYTLAKTKRYSHARIRRIVMNSFLGITAADLAISPPYIRITGFNSNGSSVIKIAKNTAKLPIITKAADIAGLGEEAHKIFGAECRAGDIYSLLSPKTLPCGSEKSFIPINVI